jgi:Zn-dependent protease
MLNIFTFDFLLLAISLLVAITIHEFSHALVADKLGDPTPRSMGRLSLNPFVHLDPLGTLALFFIRFGWGKPVPIDSYNFKNPRRDEILVSLAGPLSNLIFAIISAILLRFIPFGIFLYFIQINLMLGVFNLLPIPPLDGSKIFLNLLSVEKSIKWQEAFDKYGMVLIFILIFLPIGNTSIIFKIMNPIVNFLMHFYLSQFAGLSI